jgi:hypothetical protein
MDTSNDNDNTPAIPVPPVRRGESGGERLGGPLWSPAVPLPMRLHLKNLPL